MGKKTPKAPDPTATANAQSQANRQAIIESARVNAVDQHGPWGSTTFQRNADGTPSSQSVNLNPRVQGVFDGQMDLAQQMSNRANQSVSQLPQGPLDTSSLPGRVTSLGQSGPISGQIAERGGVVGGTNPQANELQRTINSFNNEVRQGVPSRSGDLQMQVASRSGEFQRSVDPRTGDVTNLQPQNFDAATQRAQDASFQKAQSLFGPQQQLEQQRLQQSLSDRGIPLDSPAGRAEMDRMQRAQTEQTNRAAFDAVAAGSSEHSRLFGLDATTTQINNAAAGQRFGQDLASGQFKNDATDRAFAQDLASGQFRNNAVGQAFGQDLASGQFQNAAAAQRYGQERGAFEFQNAATAQSFGQHLASNEFANRVQQQLFGQDVTRTQLGNQAQQQQFNQDLTRAGFQNDQRNASLQEQIAIRNQGLNEAGFFMGGPQMQMPQFQQTPTYGQQAPDVAGLIQQNYQTQAAQAQQRNQGITSGLFGLGSAFLMSDRRLKMDVERIGTGWRGLPLYLFRYVWGGPVHVGVMAQEAAKVAPEVVRRIGAFLAVDYDALRVA